MTFLIRRLVGAAFVIFAATTMVFLILHWLPGDPAVLVAGDDAPAATIAHVRAQLGSDQPLWHQYGSYLGHLARGDLGTSFSTQEPVAARIRAQILATVELTAFSMLIAITLGILLGVISAVDRGGWVDNTIQSLLLFFSSMPSFWLGIVLILIFSVALRWLPAIGNGSVAQLILPASCLGLASSGRLARMVRNSVLDVLDEPFVNAVRAKGLTEPAVLYRHVLRNALIPVITFFGVLTGELLSSTVVVETLFARQGLGRLIYEAIGVKDIPMVQGAVLVAAVFYVLINLVVDLSYGAIDSRIRSQG